MSVDRDHVHLIVFHTFISFQITLAVVFGLDNGADNLVAFDWGTNGRTTSAIPLDCSPLDVID